jgi:cyclopropane-fatty-acyl-phospholipid synthase
LAAALAEWRRKPRANTLGGSRSNIYHHYDIGDDFYRLWLDREMVYTCAFFPTPQVSLEEAQVAKMDLVCSKLWLKPRETVVEAGCGWGALALHMARHYGVNVKAYNVSREQIAYARKRANAEGLDSRVEFIEDDYRMIRGEFDVFVSIGMLEHVGVDHYRDLGEVIHRCLKPAGRGILHTIGRDYPGRLNAWIERRIFPGAYAPSLREIMKVLEPRSFSVLDVENLRLHYALTLQHWLDRFQAAEARVKEMFDEAFVRAWRLYLAGSLAAFHTGSLQLFQVVFARHGSNEIPWVRRR